MKSLRVYGGIAAVILALPVLHSFATETSTDSESTALNNPIAQNCGISLSLPDFLVRNNDDDQNPSSGYYEQWDLDHCPSPGDDDLKTVTITGTAGPLGGTMTLEITEGGAKINGIFWKDGEKNEHQNELSWQVSPNSSRTATLSIEGYEHSDVKGDVKMKAVMSCPGGEVGGQAYLPAEKETTGETTVYEADLDVDSNNNEGTTFSEGSKEEDVIEVSEKADGDWSKRPGKILMVNDGFGDDIPDWADGFISDVDNPDCYTCGPPITFIPMLLERKKPFTKDCKVKFTYSASDPSLVKSVDGRGFPNYDKHFTKPEGKLIRIWKKNNDGSNRIAGSVVHDGDYVPDNIEIEWIKLSDGDVANLWVEAVDPSGGLADISVEAEITENGATASDEVKFTAVKITCEPITCEPREGLAPYNPAGVVAGEDAIFKILVEPETYPDSEIKWKSDMAAVVEMMNGNGIERYARYRHSQSTWGDGSMWAEIFGNYYAPPKFSIQVFGAYTTVVANIFEVLDPSNGTPYTVADLNNLISNLNEIYQQAGMRFVLGRNENISQYGHGGLYDYSIIDSFLEAETLCGYVVESGGIEIYIVTDYADGDGLNVRGPGVVTFGIICDKQNGDMVRMSKILAHEIGHSCGLEDIYAVDENEAGESDLVFDPRFKTKWEWGSSDWPSDDASNTEPSYYKRLIPDYDTAMLFGNRLDLDAYAMRHRGIVRRLMMHGTATFESNTELDIPLGKIYGVTGGLFGKSFSYGKVGIIDMDRQPQHY